MPSKSVRILGAGLIIIGLLLFTNAFGLAPQATTCVQSIVAQVTVCSPSESYVDSIHYNSAYTIAPASNPVYVYLSGSATQTSGSLRAYYFLSEGATLTTGIVTYCSTSASGSCTPAQVLSGVSYGATSAGVKYLSVTTPTMNAGTKYIFQASITDSKGVKNSIQGAIIPASPQATFTAIAVTFRSNTVIGGSAFTSAQPVALRVYTTEGVTFSVQVSKTLTPISSITISVTPGTTYTMANLGSGTYQSIIQFSTPDSYTVSGTINFQGGGTLTAFSIRVTATGEPPATTLSSITLTNVGTFTITDSYTGVDSKTTVFTNVCGPNGCTGTTTVSGGGGSTTTISSSTSQSTTTVTGDGGGLSLFGLNQVIGFLMVIAGGVFAFRKGKR